MDVRVRTMRPDDAEAIVNILNPIITQGTYTLFDTPFSVESEREFLMQFPHRGVFHVAECCETSHVCGFQNLEPFAAYTHACDHVGIIATYIDRSFRRQGVGSRLAKATFTAARRKGYEKIFTYVRSDNPDALQFYMRHGFRIIGTAQKQAKFGTTYVDEILIEKFLS